jgi:hypothetical protein
MMKRVTIAAAVLSALVGGCGGDDGSSSNQWPVGSGDAAAPEAAAPSPEAGAVTDSGASDASTASTDDASTDDASSDGTGDGDGPAGQADGPVDASGLTCGPSPARYTLLTGADAGLVRDNVTMLVWMSNDHGAGEPPQTQADAIAYCTGRGMRLPTKDEAVALAANYASCAFGHWGTWTSTPAPAAGDAWVVDYAGDVSPQLANNFPSAVLCVRDPAG